MSEMSPRERVLTVLRREIPDRVPWVETRVDEQLQIKIMGRSDFRPADLCRRLGLDGFGGTIMENAVNVHQTGNAALSTIPDASAGRVSLSFEPPWIAEIGFAKDLGRHFVGKGLLTSREALKLFDTYLPDPDDPCKYEQTARWIEKNKEDFAVFALIRLGSASTLESMGLDVFGYAIYDDPGFVHEVHARFSAWTAQVVRHLNEIDIDFYWAADDVAGNTGPFMSPASFREFFLPYLKSVASEIKKPWIFHSDGNLFPILPDLLTLGMNALHPIQPSAMDIGEVKRLYGNQVAIAGNIDLDYTLTRGTPEEVEAEVRQKIAIAGPGGGYMITSANSLPDYCKVENVFAMADAIRKYGRYPLEIGEEKK